MIFASFDAENIYALRNVKNLHYYKNWLGKKANYEQL
jgi:hypothetical protein